MIGVFLIALFSSSVWLYFAHRSSNKLTPSQLQAQLQAQAQKPNTTNFKSYDNFESLSSILTVFQQTALKNALFKFNSSANIFTIVSGSIKNLPHDPNKTYDTVVFKLRVEQKIYQAQLRYFSLNSISLTLFFNGKVVFNSGTVRSS